jgi:hypothetical protein
VVPAGARVEPPGAPTGGCAVSTEVLRSTLTEGDGAVALSLDAVAGVDVTAVSSDGCVPLQAARAASAAMVMSPRRRYCLPTTPDSRAVDGCESPLRLI